MLFAAVQKFGEGDIVEVLYPVDRVILAPRRLNVSSHLNLRSSADACAKCNIVPGIAEEVVVFKGKKYHDYHAPKR